MNKKWVIILFLVILSVPIGWSLLTQTGDNNLTYPTTNENDGAGSQNPFAWTDWPDGLPAFIPKLEDEISFIFGPDNDRISIRYDPYVSEENVEEYIELCKENGFELSYRVFYDDRFPGAAESANERANAGEWDEVSMTRDGYKLTLDHGYSLDIEGPNLDQTVVVRKWPEELKQTVPQPEYTQITSHYKDNDGGYSLTVEYSDDDIRFDQYIQVLNTLGFKETKREFDVYGQISRVILESETIHVELRAYRSISAQHGASMGIVVKSITP